MGRALFSCLPVLLSLFASACALTEKDRRMVVDDAMREFETRYGRPPNAEERAKVEERVTARAEERVREKVDERFQAVVDALVRVGAQLGDRVEAKLPDIIERAKRQADGEPTGEGKAAAILLTVFQVLAGAASSMKRAEANG